MVAASPSSSASSVIGSSAASGCPGGHCQEEGFFIVGFFMGRIGSSGGFRSARACLVHRNDDAFVVCKEMFGTKD
jgi:hypothetical protein